jgi:hypothetical protein
MPVYVPPSLTAVDFALGTFVPADVTPYAIELAVVVPPALSAVDFALVAYTQPTFLNAGFDLSADFTPDAPGGGGGGGGGTGGGAGGGPGTYEIPAGLTANQKKAMAALLACAPCCEGSGSGSGSGSGGQGLPNCCGDSGTLTSVTFSYEMPDCIACMLGCDSGTGGTVDSGSCDTIGGEYVFPEDAAIGIAIQGGQAFYQTGCTIGTPEVLGYTTAGVFIALCCYERNDAVKYFQVNVYATYTYFNGTTTDQWIKRYRAKVFDTASCNPFTAEINGLLPFSEAIVGSPPCNCTGSMNIIMTGSY